MGNKFNHVPKGSQLDKKLREMTVNDIIEITELFLYMLSEEYGKEFANGILEKNEELCDAMFKHISESLPEESSGFVQVLYLFAIAANASAMAVSAAEYQIGMSEINAIIEGVGE